MKHIRTSILLSALSTLFAYLGSIVFRLRLSPGKAGHTAQSITDWVLRLLLAWFSTSTFLLLGITLVVCGAVMAGLALGLAISVAIKAKSIAQRLLAIIVGLTAALIINWSVHLIIAMLH